MVTKVLIADLTIRQMTNAGHAVAVEGIFKAPLPESAKIDAMSAVLQGANQAGALPASGIGAQEEYYAVLKADPPTVPEDRATIEKYDPAEGVPVRLRGFSLAGN